MLVDVYLEELMYPCFYYVKCRTGHKEVSLDEFKKVKEYPFQTIEDVPIGSVLRWDADDTYYEYVLAVKSHRPINITVHHTDHYGVYEGDGLVSDLVYPDKFGTYIRFRELDKIKSKPVGYVVWE